MEGIWSLCTLPALGQLLSGLKTAEWKNQCSWVAAGPWGRDAVSDMYLPHSILETWENNTRLKPIVSVGSDWQFEPQNSSRVMEGDLAFGSFQTPCGWSFWERSRMRTCDTDLAWVWGSKSSMENTGDELYNWTMDNTFMPCWLGRWVMSEIKPRGNRVIKLRRRLLKMQLIPCLLAQDAINSLHFCASESIWRKEKPEQDIKQLHGLCSWWKHESRGDFEGHYSSSWCHSSVTLGKWPWTLVTTV